MTYLLDSDWIISFLNGRANAIDLVDGLADAGIAVSIISCGEVIEGLKSAASTPQRVAEFAAFVNAVDVLTPDMETADRYAEIRTDLRSRGLLLADNAFGLRPPPSRRIGRWSRGISTFPESPA